MRATLWGDLWNGIHFVRRDKALGFESWSRVLGATLNDTERVLLRLSPAL
jgi:hypothetical protein